MNEDIIVWAKDIVSGHRMGSKITNEKLAILIDMAEQLNINENKSIIYKRSVKEYGFWYFRDKENNHYGPFETENEANENFINLAIERF